MGKAFSLLPSLITGAVLFAVGRIPIPSLCEAAGGEELGFTTHLSRLPQDYWKERNVPEKTSQLLLKGMAFSPPFLPVSPWGAFALLASPSCANNCRRDKREPFGSCVKELIAFACGAPGTELSPFISEQ